MVKKIWIPTTNSEPTTAAAQPVSGAYWDDAGDGVATTGLPNDVTWAPYVLSAAGPTGTTAVGGALWTPAESTMARWYDASETGDANTTVTSGRVDQLGDLSGNGYHATPAFTDGPETGQTTQNDLNVLDFGNDNGLTFLTEGLSGGLSGSRPITVLVATGSVAYDNRSFITLGSGSNHVRIQGEATSDALYMVGKTGAYTSASFAARSAGIRGFVHDGLNSNAESEYRLLQNGEVETPFSGSATTMNIGGTNSYLGVRNFSGGTPGMGPFYEALVWGVDARTLNVDGAVNDLVRAEGYIAHKWGLEGLLPASHAFKASPPQSLV